ncbi:Bug family tripartite tricarboxylate transporter substrate binding protein [Roseomonas xinghualingensis]|uniref:Bug family tripartite tricarboxylate transporter substrate binding protein n=1 Tax=Roseomonas xinghualingensis TaxID=2986475 RepID=UPI0021F1C475|nr:tripartite tricarboxylate transporter substrate binding protein [Roseomonas sp. SXEYE001]MCV4209909.1 tripartite tricarboxylate transporter substrate binding protein [Roseomonas sp. SXEYE001]
MPLLPEAVSRRALFAASGVLLAQPGRAQPATWPNRSVRVIVGYPAGGANELVARAVAAPLSEVFGQSFVVENRAGAAGSIAAEAVARTAADGYTLYMISSSQVLAPSIRRTLGFDPLRDFTPIALGARSPYFLAVHPSLPAKDVQELVAIAKAKPGALSYASSGVGAGPHLTMSLFMAVAGVELEHVPYKGDADLMADLTTGRVPVSFVSVAASYPHIKAGTLRALAVSGSERLALTPDVPTVAQCGYPGFHMDAWWGMVGPAGLPAEIVEKVAAAMRPILDAPAFAARFATLGVMPGKLGPAEFTALIRSDRSRFDEIVRIAKIPMQD